MAMTSGIKHTKGVLDLTWLDLSSEEGLAEQLKQAVSTQIKSPSKQKEMTETKSNTKSRNNSNIESAPLSPTSPKREPEVVKAVRLSNNLLENMDALNGPFSSALDSSQILWLDLSSINS